ncbi:MAG: DUF1611 domain-containing protein [Lachnospiraceae bacterium]|nr:DUF1611 domain-containing protein [Lachnospiraceae bacterium]
MKILIMDSGVHKEHPALTAEKFDGYGLVYDAAKDKCNSTIDFTDNIGHGTAVYNLIRKNCMDANIKVVKIFDEDFEISEEAFICMLTYIYVHENPDILNLSLGLIFCNDIERLYSLCQKISMKGTLIISAFDNNGAISYPAAFDCVYGVIGVKEISKSNQVKFISNSYVNICAKGTVSRLAWKNPDYVLLAGNSFSCAIATSIIAKEIMNNNIALEDVPLTNETLPERRKPSFKIGKAAIFPLNKEIHSLIRYPQLLTFKIVHAYEHRCSGRVGMPLKKLFDMKEAPDLCVLDIENIDWNSIDTLILGHTGQLAALTKDFEINKRLINLARQYNVNIYSFDPCPEYDHVFCSSINKGDLPPNHFGKLFKINKPVLGVWGTSSQQGKFTLQLILRDLLTKKNYCVGQLGTEPSALLFGMDEIFPYGYNSSVLLNEAESVIYVNRLMNNISASNCDLIIVGAQSAAISYDLNNLTQFASYQQAFLCATLPDAIVLTVSPHDDIEYIKRTINYLESVAECKVISICLFPKYIKSNVIGFYENHEIMTDEELLSHKQYLVNSIMLDVFIMGIEIEMIELVNKIIDFF